MSTDDSSKLLRESRWEPPRHVFVQCLDGRHDDCQADGGGVVFMDRCMALCSCPCHGGQP